MACVRRLYRSKLASAAINTEKARSEFIIAPILLGIASRRLWASSPFFSGGVEFNVAPASGLNGVCDFILSGSPMPFIVTAPLLTVVEAKNDNLRNGLGQCIASMVAAGLFNQEAGNPIVVIHGVVTTGTAWQFLRLRGTCVTLDLKEYYIDDPGKILGVLESLVRSS